jgi:hypothetical protein
MTVKFLKGTYKQFIKANPVIADGTIIFVTNLPWYKSWFGLKPTRMKLGNGKTTFKKLRFI